MSCKLSTGYKCLSNFLIDIFHISLFQKSLLGLFIGRTIELSSTEIFYPNTPSVYDRWENAVTFVVSLKQNSLEDFTTNGFSKILSSHLRPLSFASV